MTKLTRVCQIILVTAILFMVASVRSTAPVLTVAAADDPIPFYLNQVSGANLTATVSALVGYGPRLVSAFQVYTNDSCTYSSTVNNTNNLDRAANYAKGVLDAMGYTAVLEPVPGYGHNVIATKTGSVYPNIYIEFGAHLDTKPGTPGGNDNGSGSATVIELARVLKAYPSRYSMTFALWVGEETGGFAGAYYHIDQMLAAGKQIKVGLNMDNMGQIGAGDIYRNDVWTNTQSQDIWTIFNQVNTQYSLGLTLVNNANPCCSDNNAYWTRSLTSVASVGGWTPASPNYHGCGDVVANFNPTQAAKVAQQNLAAGLKLDQDIVPPTVTLSLSRTSMPADGSSAATATAMVKDSNNNPMLSETVAFTTNGDIVVSSPVINHGDGTYSVTLTASTTTGPEIITATDSGVSATATITETTYCPGACFTDTSVSDYIGGVTGSNTYISETTDGEVILSPTVGTEFSGSTLPIGWAQAQHGSGNGTVTVQNGRATLDGAQVYTSDPTGYPSGRAIEFAATFGGGQSQAAGFAVNATTSPWAAFDYDSSSGTMMTAYTSGQSAVNIPGTWNGSPHRYRIEWSGSNILYFIDGVQKAITSGVTGNMRPIITDLNANAQVNQVDWLRMTPYASSGTFESRVFDGGGPVDWGTVTWSGETPAGTSIAVSIRSGNTLGNWSSYSPIANGASVGISARYVQYSVSLSTTNADLTPVLNEISLRYTPGAVGPATKLGFLVQPGGAITGNPFTAQPMVAVQDASGYTVASDNSTQITLVIGTNPSGGVLTCTTNPVTVVNGVANFAGCRINTSGTGYTLTASGGSLTSATSSSFNVTQVPPASITLTLSPDTISANGTSTSIATAMVKDAGNNPLTGETIAFSTNGNVTFGSVTDNGNGTYTVTVTASTTPGDETIIATDGPVSASAILHETQYCPGACFTDTTTADFSAGTPGSDTYLAQTDNGEVILTPAVGSEFFGTTWPVGWTVLNYGGSANVTVGDGKVNIGTARLHADGLYGPGHVLEFVANYTGGFYQAGGFGYNFDSNDGTIWSAFDTAGVGTALNTNTNGTISLIPGSWLSVPHRYRLEWTATGVTYFIDGVQKDTRLATFTKDMRPIFADNTADANLLQVDWVRMSPYTSSGIYQSRVLDGGGPTAWGTASWTAETPVGTSITLMVRSGNTPTPDGTWSTFQMITNGTSVGVTGKRYLQYQAELTTSNLDKTPALKDICISYTDTTPPTIISRSPAPNATGVAASSTVTVGFSEPMLASTINASSIRLRATGAPSDVPAVVTYTGTTATLTPNSILSLATQYQVTVAGSVSDVIGNQLGSAVTWSFTIGGGTFTDSTFTEFGIGTPMNVYVSEAGNGEIILTPTIVTEFSGPISTTPPSGWTSAAWNGSPIATYGGGWASLNNAQLYTNNFYTQGRSIEFVATFGGGAFQTGGFGKSASEYPIAIFNYDAAGVNMRARTYDTVTLVPNPDTLDGSPHRYRVDWNIIPDQIAYYIDGVLVPGTPHSFNITDNNMRPLFTDYADDGIANRIDWVRMSPYAASGTFTSRIFDAGQTVVWTELSSTQTTPANTGITFRTRTGETPTPDLSWSDWQAVNSPIASRNGRYLQYEAAFSTTNPHQTPTLSDVTLSYGPVGPTSANLNYFRASKDPEGVQLSWETVSEATTAGFNLYRREIGGSFGEPINAALIPPQVGGQPQGAAYTYLDSGAVPGQLYEYKLEIIATKLQVEASLLATYWPYTVSLPLLVR